MITNSKEIMKRVIQSSYENGEMTIGEFTAVADELGLVISTSRIRTARIHPKTGRVLAHESISIEAVDDTVFLHIDSGRIKKTWKMRSEQWEILKNPTPLDEED
jgi:hypothetical protein